MIPFICNPQEREKVGSIKLFVLLKKKKKKESRLVAAYGGGDLKKWT